MNEETNLLSVYLAQRQKFYDLLCSIQEKYLYWFTERSSSNGQRQLDLARGYVDCNLDLSTLAPKLHYNPDLDSDILEECSDAFCVAFNLV